MPVKAAVTPPPAGQNIPFLGEDVKANALDSIETTPVNPFRRVTKGTESNTQNCSFKVNLDYMHPTASFVPQKTRLCQYLSI